MTKRESLLDFFDDRIRSAAPFLVYDDGYRAETRSYADIRAGAERFAARLAAAGCRPEDKVVLWGENRPEWIAAFWGCLLAGAVVVPLDVRTSADLLARIVARVRARILVAGDEAPAAAPLPGTVRWRLSEVLAAGTSGDPGTGGVEGTGGDPETGGLAGTGEGADATGSATPRPRAAAPRAAATGGDLAEIIFTSGATADPKGVEITHANLLANIVPVEREVRKYVKYGRPFFPLRFLNLLPLSHLFGQAMATFVPPMLEGVTVFMHGYNPAEIVRQIRTRRVSVLVCVPRILEVLRDELLRVVPETAEAAAGGPKRHVAVRWWRHRRTHRLFGMKFWAFVVGGAPLDPELQDFWGRLGFLVVQGYGLTETAPMVTVNHPFRTRRGSVGAPIGGVEVAIADDGEILVRGGNVTRGYYDAPEATAEAFRDGWLHTGDIGSLDASGHLTVQGRKKEMIVTPDGLNVFPEDVERALGEVAGVREAAVVGASRDGREHVHAVLVLEAGADADAVVRDANGRLEEHQRIRGCSVWPETALPRTEGTRKLRRRELARWVAGGRPAAAGGGGASDPLAAVVAEFAHGRRVADETTLAELGLGSLERIELMVALERAFDRTLDEATFAEARTVAELRALVADGNLPGTAAGGASAAANSAAGEGSASAADSAAGAGSASADSAGGAAAAHAGMATAAAGAAAASGGTGVATSTGARRARPEPIRFPTWNQGRAPALFRRAALGAFLLPLTRVFAWIRVEGLDRLAGIDGPVVYAANHQSHLDGPVILAALPPARRRRVAIAAAREWFGAHFHPRRHSRGERLSKGLSYGLAVLCFNVVPLPQREAGARDTMRYLGELVEGGSSVLIFPEGRRTQAGEIAPFQPGVGMIAARLRLPVVPVRIAGVDRILHQSWRMARPGRARVAFGAPIDCRGDDYRAAARRVEEAVRRL